MLIACVKVSLAREQQVLRQIKQLLYENTSKPLLYFRHIDDAFAIFSNKTECN